MRPEQASRSRATATPPGTPGVVARASVRVIGWYQAWSSTRVPRCRFMPSCSEYAKEAIVRRGALKGAWSGARRLVRCRPGGGMGFDPVEPEGA